MENGAVCEAFFFELDNLLHDPIYGNEIERHFRIATNSNRATDVSQGFSHAINLVQEAIQAASASTAALLHITRTLLPDGSSDRAQVNS